MERFNNVPIDRSLNFGALGNSNPDLNQKIKVFLRTNTPNQTWRETYFDGLGRTYLTKRENVPGNAICAETEYNNRGLVDGRSYPHFENSQYSYWTYFDYDAVARVTTITTFNEGGTLTTTAMTYDRELTTIIDANNHAKVKEKDGLGRLIRVDEYSGIGTPQDPYQLYATTTYQYDPMHNLVKVIDAAGNQTTMAYDTLSRKIRMTDPDMCSSQDPNVCYWIYQYDANGNLTAQTDAKGQTILFSFFNPGIGRDDPLNRVMKKDYPTGTDIVYNYDQAGYDNPKGRLTSVTDSSGMTEYFYDERGRTKKTIQTVDAVGYTIETTFDSLNRTKSIKYPDLEIVSYTYDTAGNLSSVSGAANYAYYPNYNAQGQPINIQYGNAVTTAYTYSDYTNRLTSILTSQSGQTLQNLCYEYDDVGNVKTITDAIDPARTQQFHYDHLNRLTQAGSPAYPSYPQPITYQYNQIGNMTNNSQVGSYSYPTGYPLPHPHAVTQAGSNSYTYDNNGNMLTGAGRTIVYDYDNRPISITQSGVTGFVYDYQGQRVKKTGSSTTLYIGKLYEITGGVYTKYIFAETKRVASKTAIATNYYHTDHLQSSNIITDASGSMVEGIYYFPYGATRLNSGSVNVRHKYTGQEEDAETGLYYYGARLYDPVLARFISPDTNIPDCRDPQSWNRYTYVLNNPLRYIDPTGNQYETYDPDMWGNWYLPWTDIRYGDVQSLYGSSQSIYSYANPAYVFIPPAGTVELFRESAPPPVVNTPVTYQSPGYLTSLITTAGSLIPTGGGVSVSETTDIGYYYKGAGQTGSFGRLWWYEDDEVKSVNFLTWGGFLGSGSMAYPPNRDPGEKNFAIGVFGGGGVNLLVTNMKTESDLALPFRNYFSLNLSWIYRYFSLQVSGAPNGVYVISYGGPLPFIPPIPTGYGYGASFSNYNTDTIWIQK